MEKKELYEKLQQAMIDLDDAQVEQLVDESIQSGLPPIEVLLEGLAPGLIVIGDQYAAGERFMSDLMISGTLMNEAMEKLLPSADVEASIANRKPGEHVMVIGTVEGDLHDVGKKIVSAFLASAGIKAVDIGESKTADEFVEAIKKYKPDIVGASAIIGPVTPYCGVIHKAMVDAGVREDVIYITGGWGMSDQWCDDIGADAFGENAQDALEKVKALLSGKTPKWIDRNK